MSGSPTQQENKHTPLDLDQLIHWLYESDEAPNARQTVVIKELIVELTRTRRLLEAGQRLAEAAMQIDDAVEICSRLDESNSEAMLDVNVTVAEARTLRAELSAYQEAAKP